MKTDALRVFFRYKSICVYECIEVDIPLIDLFDKLCYGMAIIGADHFCYNFLSNLTSKNRTRDISPFSKNDFISEILRKKPAVLPLKIGNKTNIITGIITAFSPDKLVEFLIKFIDLKIDCEITDFLKGCYNEYNKLDDNFLLFKLKEEYTDLIESFIIEDDDIDSSYQKFYFNKKSYLVDKGSSYHLERFFAHEKFKKIDGYEIPVLDFVYHGIFSKEPFSNKNIILSYFDNEYKYYNNFLEINPLFLKNLDAYGKLYAGSLVDLLPDPFKEVFAILRIPTKKEFIRYKKKGKSKNKNFKFPFLNNIFFIAPSLKPANFNSNIKVIDDIDIFIEIISKISSNIYIPNNISIEINADIFPDKEQFLLLEKPV